MTKPIPETHFQEIGDVALQYMVYPAHGPTIIMLHATGFSPWMWHPVARELSREYTVIAPYFCDHRVTDPEDGGLSWVLLAEDLCELCEGLQIERPILVGHSMGATVMTIAAAHHPGVARGMFLIEPIFLPREFYGIPIHVDQHPLASKSIRRRNHWEDASAARNYLKGKKLFADWDDEILDLYIEHGMFESENGGLELTCSPQREASMFMGGMPYDPWPMLPKIDCPVLIVEGEKSENRPYVHLKKAKGLIPQCDYTLFSGAGHLIPMEKPLEIAVMIKTFTENLIRKQ